MLNHFKADLKKYYKYSIISAKSQLKSEVANSHLNWLWWVLTPFCFMLIYTFIYGYVFNMKEPFFPIFLFIGISVWDFFNRVLTSSVKIVKNNKAIVSKVYIPKYILLLTQIWVSGFKMFISFCIVFIMMIFYRVPLSFNLIYTIPLIILLIITAFAIGTYLLHYGVFVEDLSNVTSIALRMLYYLTGIFYNVETRMPAPYGVLFGRYNPIAYCMISLRKVLLYGETPYPQVMLAWFVVGIMVSLMGIKRIYKNENSYVKVI